MNQTTNPATRGTPKQDRMVQLVKILVWPLTLLILLVLFKEKIAPKDLSLNEKGITISFFLLEASKRGGPMNKPLETQPNVRDIQEVAKKASELQLNTTKVLWVDDNPTNQSYERQALSALGIQFVLAKSTSEALSLLASQDFQLLITDFKRVEDSQAGYTLLGEVRKLPKPPPVIIYSSAITPELEAEAKKRGAYGETNQPQRLFSLALEALAHRK